MRIEKNKALQSLNTLAVPGIAQFYTRANSLDDLLQCVEWANLRNKAILVLGGGSNVVIGDDIDGLVLQPKIKGIDVLEENPEFVYLKVGAGENWHQFVMYCVHNNYFGIENLALIPGDCGGAPIQNIGAYGVELKDVFHGLEVLNLHNLKVESLSQQQCGFSYRDSIFKSTSRGKYIVLNMTLRLTKQPSVNITYPALKAECDNRGLSFPTARDVAEAVIAIRSAKLPDPNILPNAGSFFKNPIVSADKLAMLRSVFTDIVYFDAHGGGKKLAAAWLIEHAGWRGKVVDGVKVHERHALVITNPLGKNADEILSVVQSIIDDVNGMFGIVLEMEPQLLNASSLIVDG